MGFPSLSSEDDFEPTRPLPLAELPLQARLDLHMQAIVERHPHIALAIEQFWGHPDCVPYMEGLVMDGYKEDGQRAGFKPAVVSALLDLISIHQQDY